MDEKKRKINPSHIESLINMINESNYYKLLKLKLIKVEKGFAKVEMYAENTHLNPFGIIHGGAYASLIDCSLYWAAYCDQDEDSGFTSLDLSVTNLAMARPGKLTSEAKAVKIGRSICLCEAAITDENGRLLAHGTSKLMVLKGRQSVADAVRTTGYGALPEKFIY